MKESGAPYSLCMQVLGRLHSAGVLEKLVLVGSWCTYFYRRGKVISGRRQNKDKAANDRSQGGDVLRSLISDGKADSISSIFGSLHRKWRNAILKALRKAEAGDIVAALVGDPRE